MLSDFYRSKEWIALTGVIRLERVTLDGVLLCEYCHKPIVKAYDCICHHVIELTPYNVNDAEIALNSNNIQCVHHVCHNKIHSRFGYEERHVYLVYGSPRAGKTTYVRSIAGREDLILDIDALWNAICIEGKPDRLKQNVFGLRDELLDQIKTRRGKWRNAYVIGGYPMLMERKRFYDMYGAQPIFIDTNYEICMSRADGDWKNFVDEWWEKFVPDPPPGQNFL